MLKCVLESFIGKTSFTSLVTFVAVNKLLTREMNVFIRSDKVRSFNCCHSCMGPARSTVALVAHRRDSTALHPVDAIVMEVCFKLCKAVSLMHDVRSGAGETKRILNLVVRPIRELIVTSLMLRIQ